VSPDICNARYTGRRSRGESARSLANYIEKRREVENGREVYHQVQTFGDKLEFVRAATERAEAGRRAIYCHFVISPQRGNEFSDRDFEKLIEPWTKNEQGRPCAFYAAIHRDGPHHHLHVGVARDKLTRHELDNLKEETYERIRQRERFCDLRRDRDRPLERSPEPVREQHREREHARDDGRGSDHAAHREREAALER
jgi:relaxase-like protein